MKAPGLARLNSRDGNRPVRYGAAADVQWRAVRPIVEAEPPQARKLFPAEVPLLVDYVRAYLDEGVPSRRGVQRSLEMLREFDAAEGTHYRELAGPVFTRALTQIDRDYRESRSSLPLLAYSNSMALDWITSR